MGKHPINGHCAEQFARVRDTFEMNFSDGDELGAAFALSVEGEMVVDLWGGFACEDKSRAWEQDTLVPVSSSSKIPVALCGLILIDRGLIDPEKPVADYWPGFDQNGKAGVLVKHVFSHSSGLSGVDGFQPMEVVSDTEAMSRLLTKQAPWWKPGERSGYHAFTFGSLIGELVRLTTGRTLNDFFKEEIARPFNIDFRFGIDDASRSRLSVPIWDSEETETPEIPRDSSYYRTMGYLIDEMEQTVYWELDVSSGNGVTNARALNQIGSIVACMGQCQGKTVMKASTIERAWQEEIYVRDYIFGAPVRYGLGFGLASREMPLPWEHAMHWGGRGGSSVIMAPEARASFAYTPNRFMAGRGVMDHRGEALRDAVIRCLS
jgi:CubicO group peptidase (beta-lactamase class C family)